MHDRRECDVLVIGGGPAGSTIAGLLAQKGRHVVVLEKDQFPRFHIGESLLPLNLPLFERLGIADGVRRIGVYKPGAEVISDDHVQPAIFRFDHNPYVSVGHSYHIKRADFDKLLLDNSRRLGATVLEGMRVTGVELGADGRSRVTALGPDKAPSAWFPRFLVDASGRDTLLLKRLGLKRVDKRNNTAAVFGHFRNVPRRGGGAAGMITMHLFQHGWFWMIPLPDDIMSVGLVGDRSFFRTRTEDLDSFFARAVAASPSVAERMTNAEPVTPLMTTANYSYDSCRYGGCGYILIGDAAAFIDPLFSSGVMMAMSSAARGAEVVHAWLNDRTLGEQLMRNYERSVRRGLSSVSWLIYRINTPVLRDIFMASFDLFNTRNGLLAILAGNFYEEARLFSPLRRLQLAYGCLYLLSKLGVRLRTAGLTWRI
ncbi:MAG: NAD(P)/FAD-dependent oxidoreductase [Stellaceae bacterium]